MELYDDASKFGVFIATVILYIGIFLTVVLLLSGTTMLFMAKSTAVPAKVVNSKCQAIDQKSGVQSCVVDLVYEVNKKQYKKNLTYNAFLLPIVGESIMISYNKADPNQITVEQFTGKFGGIMLSVIGLSILTAVFVQYWLTKNFKFFAAGQGTIGVLSFFR